MRLPLLRLLPLLFLLLLALPARAQLPAFPVVDRGWTEENCRRGVNVRQRVDESNRFFQAQGHNVHDTVAGLRDTKGRCTLVVHHEPFGDALYGGIDDPEAIIELLDESWAQHDGAYYTVDDPPYWWAYYEVRDHLGMLAGYVATHKSHVYVYFDRYGRATYVAVHVGGPASDQWALLSPDGWRYYGAIYAADPPKNAPQGFAYVDERLVNRFPFVYHYQFPHMPEPRQLRGTQPSYDRDWMREHGLSGAR